MNKFIKKYNRSIFYGFLTLFVVSIIPIIMSASLYIPYMEVAKGDVDSWIPFWGSYLGAFVGVVGVYFSTRYQTLKVIENERVERIRSLRSYIVLEEFYADYELKEVKIDHDAVLFSTKNYKSFKGEKRYTFYKFKHVGGADIILDVKIEVGYDKGIYTDDYKDSFYMHVLEKNKDVFIPLKFKMFKERQEATTDYVKINFMTIEGESYKYFYDLINKEVSQILLDATEKEVLYKSKLTSSQWIFPQRKIND